MKSEIPYSKVSYFYEYLMSNIDYESWAEYIELIYDELKISNANVLEIAAGEGKLASYLKNKFQSIILSDLSFDMLKRSKCVFPKVVCDMRKLPFKSNFDFIYSTFDSVNYLMTEEDVTDFFLQVKQLLPLNGYFTFDVSLEMNSLVFEEDLNRVGEFEGIKFQQKSKYYDKKRIHVNEFIIEFPDGKNFREVHRQKIYPFQKYFELLENCGMIVTDCYEALSFYDANENSERAQFIVRRG
jgi:hypothetical protein